MQLVCLANGEASPHDGTYLVQYEPPAMRVDASGYEGGILITTRVVAEAHKFSDSVELFECWRKANGVRPYDGKPNRPLTAYTIESIPLDELT